MPDSIWICSVYKSLRQDETYLYVNKRDGLAQVPESLLSVFGEPQHVLDVLLTRERRLARVDINDVKAALLKQGFYLQMPPPKADALGHKQISGGVS